MEVIRIAGYTPEEKVEIANSYLVPQSGPRARPAQEESLRWTKRQSVLDVVTDYTREGRGPKISTVSIAALCRKTARRKAAEGNDEGP